MKLCENCGKEIEKGRFCNRSCITKWQWSNPKHRRNISEKSKKQFHPSGKDHPNYGKKYPGINYGEKNGMKNPETVKKVRHTLLDRYGVYNAAHLPQSKDYQYNRNGMKNPEISNKVADKNRIYPKETTSWECHRIARKLFYSNKCELCDWTEKDNIEYCGRKLSMHCTSVPKDYTIMVKENWMCVCHKCHTTKLDAN